jgi:copper(I)-binding protein
MNKMLIAGLGLALSSLSGCGEPGQSTAVVKRAWVRLPAASGGTGAGYFEVEADRSGEALLSVSSPAGRVEMHETMTAHQMSSMRPLAAAPLEDGKLEFAPGGKHLMIYGLDPAQKSRGPIKLILHFKNAPAVTVAARVIGAGEAPPSDGD